MLSFLVKAVKVLLAVVLSATNLFTPRTGDRRAEIRDAEPDCKASFAVFSDTHMEDITALQGMLELGFYDIAHASDRPDAVVFNGDITDQGEIKTWERFAKTVSKYDMADQYILVEGNHDSRGPVREDRESVKNAFIQYNRRIDGREISEMYYSTTIGGYPAIILGSESDKTYATLSQTQLEWFAGEMEKASKTGLPIFVFCHQPINETHGLPLMWDLNKSDPPETGGIGADSDAVLEIIQKYTDVFYISGHIHAGFSTENDGTAYSSVEKHDGYTLINIPCYMYPDFRRGGNKTNGTGYLFEVYENKVMIRARNFATGTWCTKYDVTIDLRK